MDDKNTRVSALETYGGYGHISVLCRICVWSRPIPYTAYGFHRRAATFFVDYVRRQAVGSGSSCVDSGTCGGPPLFKLSSKYQAGIFVGLATLQETYGSVLMVGEKEHVFYMSSTTFRYSMMWASPSAGSGWMWHFDGSRHE